MNNMTMVTREESGKLRETGTSWGVFTPGFSSSSRVVDESGESENISQ